MPASAMAADVNKASLPLSTWAMLDIPNKYPANDNPLKLTPDLSCTTDQNVEQESVK